jgi:hypothetical protein
MAATVLFVASNPTKIRFDFARELAVINEEAQHRPGRLNVLARWSVSVTGLKDAVTKTRPAIVHVLSPGVDPITNALILSDAEGGAAYAQPAEFARAFAGRASTRPKLVVLNTCDARSHAEAIAPHVGCVIAMDGKIFDHTAIEFTRELYSSLASGATIESAFLAARAAVALDTPSQIDVPVLVRARRHAAAVRFARPVRRGEVPRDAAAATPQRCAQIFCSYSHKDEKYRAELEAHLTLLVRQGVVDVWHDRLIRPGHDWARAIDENLDHANLVLMLISADFIASQYCYGIEMTRALERARAGDAHVVPILVRKCDLEGAPFADLQWLPTGGKPVKNWTDRDSAWTDVAGGIRKVVEQLRPRSSAVLTR